MTAWNQVTGLLRHGVKVHLYAGSCERRIEGVSGLVETLVPLGISIPIRLLGVDTAAKLHDRIVARALKRLHKTERIDIVHCWPCGARETLRTAHKLGIKTFLERPSAHTRYVYELMARECKRLGMKLNRSHYAAFHKKRLVREEEEFSLADILLCPSDFVVETFLQKGFSEKKLCRHQYGYDPSVFSLGESANVTRRNGPLRIAYVGECNPLKGLHFALEAWLRSKESSRGRFYVCGQFLPEYRERVKDMLTHPSIKYMAFRLDVVEVMRAVDAIVLPSLAEGSGVVTYEARACGCIPLVSSAAGAVCTHMEDGLIHEPGDIRTLQEHIDLLASDIDLRIHLRANSLTTAGSLTWNDAAESLLNAYRRCLDNDRSSSKDEQ